MLSSSSNLAFSELFALLLQPFLLLQRNRIKDIPLFFVMSFFLFDAVLIAIQFDLELPQGYRFNLR